VGFSALALTAALAGLGSPAGQGVALAEPAAVTSVSAPAAVRSAADVDAERALRQAADDRSATRDRLTAAAAQAGKRAAALERESRAISQQQRRIAAERKAAAAAKRQRIAAAKARAAAAEKAAAQAREKAERAAAAAKKARAAAAKARSSQGYAAGSSPREMAKQILQNKFGYGADQFSCFNNIIIRESNWDIHATNASSGAYGIPQALPGSKMATVASDWRTNPATQIIWGVQYMKSRYGSPCSAWGFKSSHGWY
jgi:hypothetical protein